MPPDVASMMHLGTQRMAWPRTPLMVSAMKIQPCGGRQQQHPAGGDRQTPWPFSTAVCYVG